MAVFQNKNPGSFFELSVFDDALHRLSENGSCCFQNSLKWRQANKYSFF
jgi:hypothetical protein